MDGCMGGSAVKARIICPEGSCLVESLCPHGRPALYPNPNDRPFSRHMTAKTGHGSPHFADHRRIIANGIEEEGFHF